MARRSLQASAEGIQAVRKAIKRKKTSQTYLAGAVNCSRQTIWSLLQGNPTDCEVFFAVCQQLGLNWEEVAVAESPLAESEAPDLAEMVVAARQQIEPYIRSRCGEMRVLDMSQPVELGSIYTSVNILEKLSRLQGLEIALSGLNSASFERFLLGEVRQQRVPGLEAVEQFAKLMILGKPGAGKTTFLKHLAIECIGGRFQPDRVPIFVTLKEFAEADEQPSLLAYCEQLVTLIQPLLEAGKAMILLDGLDEVRETDADRVLRQIRDLARQFSQNSFVITCRIAAHEYTFEQFTEVEIADFDEQQIADFSQKWFHCKNDAVKAERFLKKLKENDPIRELATNPLLLTLLCLVFEESGDFPSSRADLYQDGVDVLLKKWDAKRNIERQQLYKRLSLKRKEDLLSYVAYKTFSTGTYFFKQREAAKLISQYIENLPGASTDPEALDLDSVAVLKSIEAQHGLFVERARGIYSFSHLTFQEYFTARKIAASCNPNSPDDPILKDLVKYVIEPHWKEVFLLVTEMLESADIFLQLMKREIDSLLAKDEKLQQFLRWVKQKSSSIDTPYKVSVIRAFHFAYITNCDFSLSLILNMNFSRAIDLADDLFKNMITNLDISLSHQISFSLTLDLDISSIYVAYALARTLSYDIILNSVFNKNLPLTLVPALSHKLQNMGVQLPDLFFDRHTIFNFIEWWNTRSKLWTEQLRQLMIEHRNIGHDWQFSEEQKQLLGQYYDANKLLVKCLNLPDIFVSPKVRQEIEETLLLPWGARVS